MTRTVLIIEDNPGIGELVSMQVKDLGMEPVLVDRGDDGLERYRKGGIDLVVLDLMLPGMDALSSRSSDQAKAEEVEVDGLRIDPVRRRVFVHGAEAELTAREFDLLWHFACHRGRVFSRAQLLDAVWGYNHEGYEHTVNTHINRLRNKIETNAAEPRYVQTVWGVGYRFLD